MPWKLCRGLGDNEASETRIGVMSRMTMRWTGQEGEVLGLDGMWRVPEPGVTDEKGKVLFERLLELETAAHPATVELEASLDTVGWPETDPYEWDEDAIEDFWKKKRVADR